MPKIFLYQHDGHEIYLEGELAAATFVLHLPGGEQFALAEPLPVADLLEPHPAGGADFRFKRGALQVTLTAELLPLTGEVKVFGKRFDGAAFFGMRLFINLPAENETPAAPFVTLEICGRVSLDANDVSFATETLCFQFTLEQMLPELAWPRLSLTLPDLGWRLPSLALPWEFPHFPAWPWRLPSLAVTHPDFPLRLSWKAIQPSFQNGRLIIHVDHLRLEGRLGALIEADLHVEIKDGEFVFADCYIKFYRPDLEHAVRVPITRWHFDERCMVLQWNESALNSWLRLLAPDLADMQALNDAELTLRLLWDGHELDELRMDWRAGDSERKLQLPGFQLTIPPAEFYALALHRELTDTEEHHALTLFATVAAGAKLTAQSTFTLARETGPDKRELQGDETRGANQPLVTFTATAKRAVSAALLRLPLSEELRLPLSEARRVEFFRQLAEPLAKLDFGQPDALCLPANYQTVALRGDDWTLDLTFKLKLKDESTQQDKPLPFFLPFLKQGQKDAEGFQAISLTSAGKPELELNQQRLKCGFNVQVRAGKLAVSTTINLYFNWERFAFLVRDEEGVRFSYQRPDSPKEFPHEFLGLDWKFANNDKDELFVLVTQDGNYQLKQAEGAEIQAAFTRASTPGEPIVFAVQGFALNAGGVSVRARVTNRPARLNGLGERFLFTEGELQLHDNRLTDFSIAGAGALPPKLVGEAQAKIALQFGERNGRLELLAGLANLETKKPLVCQGTRFQFALDGLGLKFVNDGRYHLYFTLTGKARFVPNPGEDAGGPLAWLSAVELQLVECPLTGDVSVLAQHIKFLVELPKKVSFSFLGCFQMELRGIGFVPQATMFSAPTAAMELAGQIKFADAGGDVVSTEIDFHSLFIGLPAPGDLLPQLYCRHLGLKIRAGEAFALAGEVEYFDQKNFEAGLDAKGFSGKGVITIQGLPEMAASFTFLRVSRDGGQTWARAWFIYLEARKMSLRIPPINIFLREVGLGFGYRYTLASIKTADEISDPKQLLKALKKLALTQGELARRDQWRIDLEAPGEDARWTVALRALIAQTSATQQPFGWEEKKERDLPCLFVMDAVVALRSDLTFLMAVRAWLNTNYYDFVNAERLAGEKKELRNQPLLSGFVLLSPRQKRLLAHFASNPGAIFGDHPPLLELVKTALRNSRFSATLLIEPNLIHYELGWPNQLRWGGKFGPLTVEYRGGMIWRISDRELVIGQSFMARGALEISAAINLGFLGARLSATAQVAYGARYIGVLGFDKPAERSALYGAIGLEVRIKVRVEFWIRIKLFFAKITIRKSFSFSINLTAFLEVGVTAKNLAGVRGTATVSLRIMGRNLHFNVRVGINDKAVDEAFRITNQYLKIGLEAEDVEALPGSAGLQPAGAGGVQGLTEPAPQAASAPRALAARAGAAVGTAALTAFNADAAAGAPAPQAAASPDAFADFGKELVATDADVFEAPDYTIFSIQLNAQETYFLFLPNEAPPQGQTRQPFYPVPPDDDVTPERDFEWTLPPTLKDGLKHFDPFQTGDAVTPDWQCDAAQCRYGWRINWEAPMSKGTAREIREADIQPGEDVPFDGKDENLSLNLQQHLRQAYLTAEFDTTDPIEKIRRATPVRDPGWLAAQANAQEDRRVHHPSADAVESAVRGAVQQIEGSPYLKPDARTLYEQSLQNAFAAQTTIYAPAGEVTPQNEEAMLRMQQAIQFRSVIVQQLVTELQEFAQLVREGKATDEFRRQALAFQMGLVFKAEVAPSWLDGAGAPVGTMSQRTRRNSPRPDSAPPSTVQPFNTTQTSFAKHAPQFQRVKHFSDAGTVAITWDLVWPENVTRDLRDATQGDPEQHLQHYLVRRRALDGREPEVEFTLRNVEVLNHDGSGVLERLRARFQLVEHFNDKTAEDLAALPLEGRRYAYTITPVDVAGQLSERPLTVVVTCKPNEPPPVPADAEVLVKYKLAATDFNPVESPRTQPPAALVVQWTPPAASAGAPNVGVREYRLVFRKEQALPVGAYGLDSESQGGRTAGLPTSNARPLRTDIVLSWPATGQNNLPVIDPVTKQRKLQHLVALSDLRRKHVLPEENEPWRPEAWRVFMQTVSGNGGNGVASALAPVQIHLQFRTLDEEVAANLETRTPGLLEWLARPLRFTAMPPADGKGVEDGLAHVPMPRLSDQPAAPDPAAFFAFSERIHYQPHPDKLRALRFVWNQGSSAPAAPPVDLHAGYQLYEFDIDAQTSEVLEKSALQQDEAFYERLRRVQELEALSPDNLRISPPDNAAAQQWEAWYPSALRRLRLHRDTPPPARSEATRSPWYGWRDSLLEWPDDTGLPHPEEPPTPAVVLPALTLTGAMKLNDATEAEEPKRNRLEKPDGGLNIFSAGKRVWLQGPGLKDFKPRILEVTDTSLKLETAPPVKVLSATFTVQGNLCSLNAATQTLSNPDGGLGDFQPGQYLRLTGAQTLRNNGIKRIKNEAGAVSATALQFEAGSFFADETDVPLGLDGSPFVGRHPFLDKLLDDLARVSGATVVTAPLPAAQPGTLQDLLNATAARLDPYGWNILKRMGLAVTFILRDRVTGALKSNEETLKALQAVVPLNHPLARHLHIELLFQPAQQLRLPAEAPRPVTSDALLAVTQLSLRPALRQVFGYFKYEIKGQGGEIVQLEISHPAQVFHLIEQTGEHFSAAQKLEAGKTYKRGVSLPANGQAALLFRCVTPDGIVVQRVRENAAPERLEGSDFAPTDWLATYFAAPETGWPRALAGQPAVGDEWQRFRHYLLRLNPLQPSETNAPKIELLDPAKDPAEKLESERQALLEWLQRFFDASGDVLPGKALTGAGPWLATAYPRGLSPVGVTPNAAGQLKYYLPVADQWAHLYRYYVLPAGRYDRLWQALAQSDRLFPTGAKAQRLRPRAPEFEGGLDVVLDRLRPIAPPLALFSGRLDPPSRAAELAPPGQTWEVILAQHPEQALIERNRTLARQLAYRQTAHTLLRRFAYADEFGQLQDVLQRELTARLFAAGEPVAMHPDQKLWLLVDEASVELTLAENTLAGLKAAINQAAIPDPHDPTPADADRMLITAEVVTDTTRQEPQRLRLALFALPETRLALRTERGDPASNLLLAKPKYRFDLQFVTTAESHTLPAAYAAPEHLPELLPEPLDEQHADAAALRTLDVPLRLRDFSRGALVLQWEALPYFYEHRLLLVAQTTTDASPLTELRQRDFEYQSPAGLRAEFDVVEDAPTRQRRLAVRVALASYWDCLPPAAREHWSREAPAAADGRWRKLASLPDTAVRYQFVLAGDAGVVEAQAELSFAPDQTAGYLVRQLAPRLGVKDLRLLPPANSLDGAAPLRFEAALEFAEVRDAAVSEEPVSHRATFAAVAATLGERADFARPLSCVLALTGRLTDTERAALRDWGQSADVALATAVNRLLEQVARLTDDRTTVFAEASVSFEQLPEICPAARLTLPTATSPVLIWRGALDEEQRQTLARWQQLSIFGATFEALIKALDAVQLTYPFTGDGPAALPEVLQPRLTLADTQFTWAGLGLNGEEHAALVALRDETALGDGFRAAIRQLLEELTAPTAQTRAQARVEMPPGWRPRGAAPAVLGAKLLVAHARLRFTGWMSRAEAERLRDAQSDTAHPDRRAIARLYRQAIQAGLAGGQLQLITRRGSAKSATLDFTVDL